MTLDEFYQSILQQLQARHVPCAITGGLACVQFGVAEHTEDCDLLCSPEQSDHLLQILARTNFLEAAATYRGFLSAPLDSQWLQGGWTCHFTWKCSGPVQPHLDIFGVPPRMSSPWSDEARGFWAGRHTVAEMKRTNRRKDWDLATALGIQMLRAGDERGWLHVFDADALSLLFETMTCKPEILAQRPVLKLLVDRSPLLARAVQTEVDFWTHLNRLRLKIYEDAARTYVSALRAKPKAGEENLASQHAIRLSVAEKLLPPKPLRDYGLERFVAEAKTSTIQGLNPDLLQYLPDAMVTLQWLL